MVIFMKYIIVIILFFSGLSSLQANEKVNGSPLLESPLDENVKWVLATVVSEQKTEISSEVEGIVTSMPQFGSRVTKDTLLARINYDVYKYTLKEQELSLERSLLEFNYLKSERDRALALKEVDSISDSEFRKIVFDENMAKLAYLENKAKHRRIKEISKNYNILSPFDGQVTERFAAEGSYVEVGDSLFSLTPSHANSIRVFLPQRGIAYLMEKVDEIFFINHENNKCYMSSYTYLDSAVSNSNSREVRFKSKCKLIEGLKFRLGFPDY